MNKEPLVSVVVPVYNVERYVKKCLTSIVTQTYKNLEILVVNDGSPDNSEDIILGFAKNDNRIKYIKRENGGLGAARNTGIEAATGEYICFVDSDDWVSEVYIETLLKHAEFDDADIVVCNMAYVYSDGRMKPRTPFIKAKEVIGGIDGLKEEFLGNKYKFHAPNKMFKSELINGNRIRFPEGKLYEDVFTTYKAFIFAKKVSLVPETLYFYLQSRQGSIMTNTIKPERFSHMYEALHEIIKNPIVEKCDLSEYVVALYCINVISLVNYIYPIWRKEEKIEAKNYENIIRVDEYYIYLNSGLDNKYISKINKIRLWGITRCFGWYCKMMRVLKIKHM